MQADYLSFFFFPDGAADGAADADGLALADIAADGDGFAEPTAMVDALGAADALAIADGFALALAIIGELVVGFAELLLDVLGPEPLPSQAPKRTGAEKTAAMTATETIRMRFGLPTQR